jgi:hypothetical protein
MGTLFRSSCFAWCQASRKQPIVRKVRAASMSECFCPGGTSRQARSDWSGVWTWEHGTPFTTGLASRRAKSIIGVPPVLRIDSWISVNDSAGNIRLQDFDLGPWRQWGHRRDAYDTLGSATSASLPGRMFSGSPGTSCLATIMVSLRDKIHSAAEASPSLSKRSPSRERV